jgi:hypothetical protein
MRAIQTRNFLFQWKAGWITAPCAWQTGYKRNFTKSGQSTLYAIILHARDQFFTGIFYYLHARWIKMRPHIGFGMHRAVFRPN